ncbi:hypothetical protein Ahy_A01g004391 [Arachis hypogaea]|uniref:Phosphoribosylglycinamide synthetase ATP-grasp (A) domain-containing protein n=1 Tax=Arachis hypogaea TaxID=3818 RepID=A0A445EVZ3_ARAHY|nr:hypothetical protein Ahy_A01g004391 [Arachis hypogaea]
MDHIITPTVKGMSAEGCKFVGVLYAGLMIEKKFAVPKLIKYNVRFIDPECQVLNLFLLRSLELSEIRDLLKQSRLDKLIQLLETSIFAYHRLHHQSFLPNQNIQLGRSTDTAEPNDFVGAMNTSSSPHSSAAAAFESIGMQKRVSSAYANMLINHFCGAICMFLNPYEELLLCLVNAMDSKSLLELPVPDPFWDPQADISLGKLHSLLYIQKFL